MIKQMEEMLCRLAASFNQRHIRWAVGGSMLLYLKGMDCEVHDIDIMIREEDVPSAMEVLSAMGTIQERKPNPQFATRVFIECQIVGIDLDIMAGFAIYDEDGLHAFPLLEGEVTGSILLNGQQIPLHSVHAWREYYRLMKRDQKVAMIDELLRADKTIS